MPNQTATLGAAQAVDRGAFDTVILPLQGRLMRLALGLTHDAGDAHDLVQDALERALREWARFTPGTNAHAWTSAILSRLFIDRWRRRKRQPRLVDLERLEANGAGALCGGGIAGAWGAAPDTAVVPPPPWEAVSDAELTAAVARLPARLRAVYELSMTEHRSYVDISLAVGIPVSTVGTRLLRARRHLRATLERQLAARGGRRDALSAGHPAILVPAPSTGWARARPVGPSPSPSRAPTGLSIALPARARALPAAGRAARVQASSLSALG
jgi:RNA polymerase sigma-70 factor (ECF subfamily)